MKNLLIKSFKGVTAKQKAFFFTLMEYQGNLSKTCQHYGISHDTYYRWMQKDEVKSYKDFVISLYTEAHDAVVWQKLVELVTAGDIKAIRTYLEVRGKLKPIQNNIDARNVQYTVRFEASTEEEGTPDTVQASPEPETNTSRPSQI